MIAAVYARKSNEQDARATRRGGWRREGPWRRQPPRAWPSVGPSTDQDAPVRAPRAEVGQQPRGQRVEQDRRVIRALYVHGQIEMDPPET